jgi:hypothetical protein
VELLLPAGAFIFLLFALLGAQKAGTSSLWNYLSLHPDIIAPVRKEVLFFNDDCHQKFCLTEPGKKLQGENYQERCNSSMAMLEDYLESGRFPLMTEGLSTRMITGEASASYLACTCCPSVVRRLFPAARLIVVLRKPEMRAQSRFDEQSTMSYRYWTDSYYSFEHFVSSRLQRITNCLQMAANLSQKVYCAADDNVIGWSLYDIFIRNWREHFPLESFLFIRNEDLRSSPAAVMLQVEQHLGLAPHKYSPDKFVEYNTRGCLGWNAHPQAKNCDKHVQPLTDAADVAGQVQLRPFYRSHVKVLQKITGLDLHTWIAGDGSTVPTSVCAEQDIFNGRFQKDLKPFAHRKYRQQDLDQMLHDMVSARADLRDQITVVQIIDNRLYCVPIDGAKHKFDSSCFPKHVAINRNFWLLYLLNQTLAEHSVPDVQFMFGTNDFPFVRKSEWQNKMMNKSELVPMVFSSIKSDQEYDLVAPSHVFIDPAFGTSWRHWHSDEVQGGLDANYSWETKVAKAVWRGRDQVSYEQTREYNYRRWLWETTRNQTEMYDVGITDGEEAAIAKAGIELAPRMSIIELAEYKYLLQLDGVSASSRYMKLMLLNSVVFKQKSIWYEFFESALSPNVHFIPFEFAVDSQMILNHKNLSDQIEWARAHDEAARTIGDSGRQFARKHLSPEAAMCAWKNLLQSYSALLQGPIIKHSKAEGYSDFISTAKEIGPLTRFVQQLSTSR